MTEWSTYQENIFKAVKDTRDNLFISAVAGSGKTTTLVELAKYLHGSSIFVAFNKKIADEMFVRLPGWVTCSTLHSLAYRVLKQTDTSFKVNNNKVTNIIKYGDYSEEEKTFFFENSYEVRRFFDSLRMFATEPTLDEVAVANPFDKNHTKFLQRVWKQIIDMESKGKRRVIIDFNDMLVQPLWQDLEFPKYDNIIIDEVQDLNEVQFELVSRMCHDKTRVIGAGDRNQSIYAFRGADHFAVDVFTEKFQCTTMPLSICYRCASSIVERAWHLVPEIEAGADAPEGVVEHITTANYPTGSLVLCRNTKPLVEEMLRYVRGGSTVFFVNKDMSYPLKRLGKDFLESGKKGDAFILERLEKYSSTYYKRVVQEQWEIIKTIIQGFECKLSPKMLCDTIDEIMPKERPKTPHITFSTIHGSKGDEYDTVYLYRPDLIPSMYAETQMELQQEDNLLYVAITRAINKLYYVAGE